VIASAPVRAAGGLLVAALLALGLFWDGPTTSVGAQAAGGRVRVTATTEIIADLVWQVGGAAVESTSIVPPGGDPHSYDPTPADAARIARADVTFTNHLLLEEQALIEAVDANAREGTPNVSLAESAETYGARVRPLVEDLGLDVIWLGLRVRGDGAARGAKRTSEVLLRATQVTGPGHMAAYVTEALGQPTVLFNSADGLDATDETSLPPAAHTHLNWAFTEPGVYTLRLAASVRTDGRRERLRTRTFRFAVGINARRARTSGKDFVLDAGHTDLTVDLDSGQLYALSSPRELGGEQTVTPADEVVIAIPPRARTTVPRDPRFAFLGEPGARVHQLPQAVLGRHVHGEIDPHLWADVANAKAYVQLIRDTLARTAPESAATFRSRAARYLDELERLDAEIRRNTAAIPEANRQLVTTHDAFGYLADAYDLEVAGFVVPNPAQQPSADQVRKLSATVRDLQVPAVFVEPNLAARATVLRQVAADNGVAVCTLYGDAFDAKVRSYVAMMRHNGRELRRCLGGGAA